MNDFQKTIERMSRNPDEYRWENRHKRRPKKNVDAFTIILYFALTIVAIMLIIIGGVLVISGVAKADIVEINVDLGDGLGSKGTGTVIWDGYIATAYHVVNYDKGAITINAYRDNPIRSATVVATDVENDIAILKTDTSGLNKYAPGKWFGKIGYGVAIGYLDSLVHYTNGVYEASKYSNNISYRGGIYEGQSGGALLDNDSGKVVGIISAWVMDKDTCGYAGSVIIPIERVTALYSKINKVTYNQFTD